MTITTELKELLSLAEKALTDSPWEFDWFQKDGIADCGIHCKSFSFGAVALFRAPRYVKEADWRDLAGYVCAASPKAIKSLLLALERAEERFEEAHASRQQYAGMWADRKREADGYCAAMIEARARAEQAEAASAMLVEKAKKVIAEWDQPFETLEEPDTLKTDEAITELLSSITDLPTHTTAHLERVRKLEANQRTPGTVEVCATCGVKFPGSCGASYAIHGSRPPCPIRQQKDKPA